MSHKPFMELDILEVNQPFGLLYVMSISAEVLLKLCFTDPLRYELGQLKGTQRALDEERRVREIKEFVEGYDAAFPNSIIISANYDEYGLNCDDDTLRWRISNNKLIIPTDKPLASIIDGQHRLFGFKNANESAKKMELVCSVYLDLPNALQAFLFATINSNQKPVDKSLAYEQFGFDIEKDDPVTWAPDKLAIALYKRLNSDSTSPFYNHIKIAPQIDQVLRKKLRNEKWLVSTATVVDGIIRLISTNPKNDKNQLRKLPAKERKRKVLPADGSALRELYLDSEDLVILKIVSNYFLAASNVLFEPATQNSSIIKTIGIQGLFDSLRKIILFEKREKTLNEIDLSYERFQELFTNVSKVDFTNDFYQYSAVGKSNISETILLLNNFISTPEIDDTKTEMENEKIFKKLEQHSMIKKLAGAIS